MSISAGIYAVSFGVALATSALTFPFWRQFCFRAGLVDDPGERKIHHQRIPLAGGLTVLTGLLVPLLAGWLWLASHTEYHSPPSAGPAKKLTVLDGGSGFLLKYGYGKRGIELAGILAGAIGMLLVGCADDRYELRALPKFGGQLAIALVVAASGARITLFVPSALFSYAVTILWILTIINAFNFMDNMNGLCTGLGAIAAALFGGVAAVKGQYLVALLAFTACGALAGFLPFNFPRAKAFLGDSGSHLVGYLLAVLGILPHFYTRFSGTELRVLTPLFVLAVPLVDMAWVVFLRWRKGQPFYIGDTNHLSHRLVRAGLSPAQAVVTIWGAAAGLGALPLLFW